MIDGTFFHSPLFTWVILPGLIFLARICDVSIGTVRIIFVARGKRFSAPFLGFFEVLIWLIAIGQIMLHLDNPLCYIAYACGFAMGNFIGITIEEKLALGQLAVRIFTSTNGEKLMQALKETGCGVTVIDARGTTRPVSIIYTIIKRRMLPEVGEIINTYCPRAFYTIEDVRLVSEGVFPIKSLSYKGDFLGLFRRWGKRK